MSSRRQREAAEKPRQFNHLESRQFIALATDGDGTLMRGGHLARTTVAALKRWRRSGRKVILVTGETPKELCDFRHLELFDRLIAENGALLLRCDRSEERKLAKPPPARLVRALKSAGIKSLKRGRLIFQAELHDLDTIASIIKKQRTKWKLVRNRDELMVVPPGVTKATGLAAALKEMKISRRQVVGVGDAENDAAMLAACGLGVAVHNAVPELKAKSKLVTSGSYGKGITELIGWLINGQSRQTTTRSKKSRSAKGRKKK